MELGVALHRAGTPSDRLEGALSALAHSLGLNGQFFTTPTQIMAAFGEPGNQHTAMARVEPGDVDLDRLAALDALADAVIAGELALGPALVRVREIQAARARYAPPVIVLAFGLVSAAAGRFFDGGWWEIAAAGGIGLIIGALALLLARSVAGVRVYELGAAFVAAAAAHGIALAGAPVSFQIATLAGLIVLVPGFTLTVAMTELATRNLVSGTARLTLAAVAFLEIAFGVALAEQVMARVFGATPVVVPAALPAWTEPAALAVAALAVGVLFHVHPRSLPGVSVACVGAFYGARLGAVLLGPELGAFVGGFGVAVAANAYARIADRPALVPLVPGILLLVPGSLGYRSLSAMLADDVITGIDTAFAMILVAVSLVAGLLVANAVVSPRRNL
jgi:uncharacterized membrane protein YjjP (DUF1212 family)